MPNFRKIKFPHSANLFLLCKEILSLINPRGETVIDQDVGSLLEFDPADCTHWKQGRRNIQSLQSLYQIAYKLEIDIHSIIDAVQGRKALNDIIQDFKSYGSFECDTNVRFYLQKEATNLIKKAKIKSYPISIPQIISVVPQIEMKMACARKNLLKEIDANSNYIPPSSPRGVEFCGSFRFLLMQKFANIYLEIHHERLRIKKDFTQAECNLFALFLLAPTELIQNAVVNQNHNQDIVNQLAGFFELTPFLINTRLKDFFLHNN